MWAQFRNQVSQTATQWSTQFGTGDLPTDLMILLLIISFTMLILGLLLLPKDKRNTAERLLPELERVQAMNGRLEKIERTLNEFRTEAIRQGEMSKTAMEYLKADVVEARDGIQILLNKIGHGGSTPPSSSGSGSGSIGGGSDSSGSGDYERGASAPLAVEAVREDFEALPSEPASVGIFSRLKKSRENLLDKVKGFFAGKATFDQSMFDQLEEVLIASDMGVTTSMQVIEAVRTQLTRGQQVSEAGLFDLIRDHLANVLLDKSSNQVEITPKPSADGPFVVMLVGVNGAGKTTTVAKLAHQWRGQGLKVMVAAADTFRAAAVDQLKEWADRIQVPIISGADGAKPATVVYDAMQAAKRDQIDVLIIDTAGRLQNKSNLMQELEGIKNVMSKHQASAPHEVLLVVDGSSGQNALSQAREFNSVTKLTGLVVTKLDGTAKGGIVVAIKTELNIPVKYIGVGEKREDMRVFNATEFAGALVNSDPEEAPVGFLHSGLTKSSISEQLLN